MAAVLAFLKSFEPLIAAGFDNSVVPELQKLADSASSPDVKIVLDALVLALKAVGDAELPKI